MANLELPFRGDQFSFALNCKGPEDKDVDIDLSAVVFDREGNILDTVHPHKPSALEFALVSNRDKDCWLEGTQDLPGDDVIHVLPKKLDPAAEVIALVVSAPHKTGRANDLSCSSLLELVVSYQSEGEHGELTNHKKADLKPYVSEPHPDGAQHGLGNGQQSMLAALVYLDKPGWTVHEDRSTYNADSYGALVPDLKAAIMRIKAAKGVDLDACRAIEAAGGVDATEVATFTRAGDDRSLAELAGVRRSPPLAEAAGEDGAAAAVPQPTKLRIDVGWSVWKKPKVEGEEDDGDGEPEGTEPDFMLVFYDTSGAEVQQVSSSNTEADGVKVGREFDEEPEPEPEAEAEEGEGEGGGEDGEGGEGGGTEVAPPLAPAEDPYAFTLRHEVFVDLAALPKTVHTAVLIVTNFAGAGLASMRHMRARVYDVSAGEDSSSQKAPTSTPRELADYGIVSKYQADVSVTMVALLKLYKEYSDSAFSLWAASGTQSVAEFVADAEAVKAALKKYQEGYKAFKAEEARLTAAAEDAGDELAYEVRAGAWRLSVPSLMMPGESLEDAEHDVKNLTSYDGPLASREARTCPAARVTYAPKELPEGQEPQTTVDTFFGGYANDVKSGPGVYLFANGAAYVGMFAGGKREGLGCMILPDGGLYEGYLVADKFDGQGQYSYPDGSKYTGMWAGGKKHGPGVFWDTVRGCLRGSWVNGVLKGAATYDQPAVRFEGEFVAGVPAGACQYTLVSHRTLRMDKFAGAHINDCGPTLRMRAEYLIPAGSGADPALDEDGNPVDDPDKPPLPAFPKYEGLGFRSAGLPTTMPNVAFPPPEGLVDGINNAPHGTVPIKGVPAFSVEAGLQPATVDA